MWDCLDAGKAFVVVSHPLDCHNDSFIHDHGVLDRLKTLVPGMVHTAGLVDAIGATILL
jgi:hypothetical protein